MRSIISPSHRSKHHKTSHNTSDQLNSEMKSSQANQLVIYWHFFAAVVVSISIAFIIQNVSVSEWKMKKRTFDGKNKVSAKEPISSIWWKYTPHTWLTQRLTEYMNLWFSAVCLIVSSFFFSSSLPSSLSLNIEWLLLCQQFYCQQKRRLTLSIQFTQ